LLIFPSLILISFNRSYNSCLEFSLTPVPERPIDAFMLLESAWELVRTP
jgi:hypothetical protein